MKKITPKETEKKQERDPVPALIKIPLATHKAVTDKIKAEKGKLKVHRAASLTGVVNSLLHAWTQGKVDPWS